MNKLSIHIIDQINKLLKEKRKYKLVFHKEPSIEELATILNTNKDKIIELENLIKDTEYNYEEIKPFSIDNLTKEEYNELVKKVKLNKHLLSNREEEILLLSLGLVNNKKWSFEELAEKYNITKERVRQIQAKSIRTVRNPKRRKNRKNYLD